MHCFYLTHLLETQEISLKEDNINSVLVFTHTCYTCQHLTFKKTHLFRGSLESLISGFGESSWSLLGWCLYGPVVLDEQQPLFRVVVAAAEPQVEPQQSRIWILTVPQREMVPVPKPCEVKTN